MFNFIILMIEIIVIFTLVVFSKKFFGKLGLFIFIALAAVLANFMTAKQIELFGIDSVCGTVLFASSFLATDILTECYGEKAGKKAVWIGLFAIVLSTIAAQITLAYIPSETDLINDSMKNLFSLNLRINIASAIMYFVANMLDVILYSKLKAKMHGNKIWLRNNLCTILCNCGENFGFALLAFIGILDIRTILMIALMSSVIEIIVALCDTPFLYLAKNAKVKEEL